MNPCRNCFFLRRSAPLRHSRKAKEKRPAIARRNRPRALIASPRLAASQVKLNQEEGIRAAFYVPWDAASFSSLRAYSRQIDILYPDWLHVHLSGRTTAGHRRSNQQVLRRRAGQHGPPGRRPGDAVSQDGRPQHGSLPHGEQLRRRELVRRHRGLPEQSGVRGRFSAARHRSFSRPAATADS